MQKLIIVAALLGLFICGARSQNAISSVTGAEIVGTTAGMNDETTNNPEQNIQDQVVENFNHSISTSNSGPSGSVSAAASLNFTVTTSTNNQFSLQSDGNVSNQVALTQNIGAAANATGKVLLAIQISSSCQFTLSATCAGQSGDALWAFAELSDGNDNAIASFGYAPAFTHGTSGASSGTSSGILSPGAYQFEIWYSAANNYAGPLNTNPTASISNLSFSIQAVPEPSAALLTAFGLLPFLKRGKRAERC